MISRSPKPSSATGWAARSGREDVAGDGGGGAKSEYQCYEFVAIDRPLTAKQMAELRAISTRAEISPTRFWNEYNWGDLKAGPAKLMARYFDAHRYFANWGTRRLMLRLPNARVASVASTSSLRQVAWCTARSTAQRRACFEPAEAERKA